MKLLIEQVDMEDVSVLTENVNGTKFTYIVGPYIRAEVVNGNRRKYPLSVVEPAVDSYKKEFVNENRALGELGHPDGPKINLERSSHLIVSLERDGNDYIGKSRIMNTPYGMIAQNMLEAGVKLGVSTRGVGSLREQNGINIVQSDFQIRCAADIVHDPSAPNAFVQSIVENAEWVFDEINGWKALEKAEDYKKYIKSEYKRIDEAKALNMFKSFLNSL